MDLMLPVLLICVGAVLQGCFIAVEHKEKYVAADILKGCAALCFVLLGVCGYFTGGGESFALKIVFGLLFGMMGDTLLNLRFVIRKQEQKIFLIGIFVFFIGHLLYLAAFLSRAGVKLILIACIIGAVITAGFLYYVYTTMHPKKVFKIFGVFYMGAVDIMMIAAVLMAITNPVNSNLIRGIGAVAFMVSDAILIFYIFGNKKTFPMRISNLSIYYFGQILIALSLFF